MIELGKNCRNCGAPHTGKCQYCGTVNIVLPLQNFTQGGQLVKPTSPAIHITCKSHSTWYYIACGAAALFCVYPSLYYSNKLNKANSKLTTAK